jgi:hypothetical protein
VKDNVALTISSLLSVLLFSFHIADDIVRGFEEGDLSNAGAFPIFLVWLVAIVMLAGKRSGLVVLLLLSILSSGVPLLHMSGKGMGVHGSIGGTSGAFFFVWTNLALGATSLLSAFLAARGLWRLRRRSPAGALEGAV